MFLLHRYILTVYTVFILIVYIWIFRFTYVQILYVSGYWLYAYLNIEVCLLSCV